MKTEDIVRKLQKQKNVYIFDSFNDVAVRIESDGKQQTGVYLKVVGGKEKKAQNRDVYDYTLGGKEITKEQYDKL